MKNKILIFAVIGILILMAAIVAAQRFENNHMRYGIIDENGTLIQTSTPINNVSIIGFICSSPGCGGVSGNLFSGVLKSVNDFIQLAYPTNLLSTWGYGVYFYKPGYIPFEVAANWFGTNPADPVNVNDYLSRKQVCIAGINNFAVTFAGGNIKVKTNVHSPIEDAGPLSYIPPSIVSEYTANISVNLEVRKNNASFYTETRALGLLYSGNQQEDFTFAAPSGNYQIYVWTSVNDLKCISFQNDSRSVSFNVPQDNIACHNDSECGQDSCFESSNYCFGGDAYHVYTQYTCQNPGTTSSFCSSQSIPTLIADCTYGCENKMCVSS